MREAATAVAGYSTRSLQHWSVSPQQAAASFHRGAAGKGVTRGGRPTARQASAASWSHASLTAIRARESVPGRDIGGVIQPPLVIFYTELNGS